MPEMRVPPIGTACKFPGGGFTGIAMPTGAENHILACEFLNKEREVAMHHRHNNSRVRVKKAKSDEPDFYLSSSQAMQNWADKMNPTSPFATMSLNDVKQMTSTDVMFYKGKDNGSQKSEDLFSCLAPRDYTVKYMMLERAQTAAPSVGGGRSMVSSRSGSLARLGSSLSRPTTSMGSRPRRQKPAVAG